MADRYFFDSFEMRCVERRLLDDGKPVALGASAFDVLRALIETPGGVVTKEQLFDLVWPGLVVEENNLQVQVSALRKLLGSRAIATVPGRALILMNRDDAPLVALVKLGQLRELASIPEPADPPYYAVVERQD